MTATTVIPPEAPQDEHVTPRPLARSADPADRVFRGSARTAGAGAAARRGGAGLGPGPLGPRAHLAGRLPGPGGLAVADRAALLLPNLL
ncbi:hypothetical protein [Streptomyces sp. NBC_00454]|uniref:hypothetical protein n=1 Tax=Streptomyces sp. NBC_00454 TaxID=2975747 RepID=UPI0030E1D3D0